MAKVRPLPEDLQEVAIKELNERPEQLWENIESLRTWIEQEPHLKARTDDQFLVAFLRGCKYSLEKAKAKIDKFYTLRTKYPDFYTIQNMNELKILELLRYGIGVYLPTPLYENGPRIHVIRPGCYPADKFSFEEVMRIANTFTVISLLEDDYAIVNGFIDVMDMGQLTTAHMFQMTPGVVKKMTIFSEEAIPLRQKSMHFINTSAGFEKLFSFIKPLMPQKQQERLFVHGSDMEKLYAYVPQKYLPKEYGGENGSIKEMIDVAVEKYFEYRQFFIDDVNYCVDESKRKGNTMDYDSIFGIEGSFRKINVD